MVVLFETFVQAFGVREPVLWTESTRFQSGRQRSDPDQAASRLFYCYFTHLYGGGEGRFGNHWQEDDSDPVGGKHTVLPSVRQCQPQAVALQRLGRPVSALRNKPPFTVPQHHHQQDEGQRSCRVQQQGPPRHGHADLRGI